MTMGIQISLWFIFVFFMVFLSSSQGYKFYVGGRDGWVTNPSENYNHWAERNRFQVNDTLLFKFKEGNDSVLIVTKENYNQCNPKEPIKSITEGDSEFKFERSGPHYFISGNSDNCNKGQKLIIVVLAVRHKKQPTSPTPMISPVASPSPSPASSALGPALASQTPSSGPAPSPWAADGPATNAQKSSSVKVWGHQAAFAVVIGFAVIFFFGSFVGRD